MLDPSDPRATLASYGGATRRPQAQAAPAQYLNLKELEPSESTPEAETWWVRGHNFVVAYTEAQAGAWLVSKDVPDESVLLVYDPACWVDVYSASGKDALPGRSLAIVPPGDSEVEVKSKGRLVRFYSNQSSSLLQGCLNREAYSERHPNVAPVSAGQPRLGGNTLRIHSIDVNERPDRFGRIWRTSNLMVNLVTTHDGPRDTTKLSPHSHDDFEQGSLLIEGECIQHVRYPWLTDFATWRPDEHMKVSSPSLTIFPPPCIHTSMWVSEGRNQLVDIFAPPRLDWAQQPGWVLNADEYPPLV